MSAVSAVVDVSSADGRQQCPSNGRQRTLEYGPLNPQRDQGNMRLRRYSHLQLHVAVPAYSQVTQQRAGNATAATCTRRFLQVSARPVLSVYPQSHLQFTCNSESSKCNIKLYNMIKCSAKSLVPTLHTGLGMRRIQNNFFERQLWSVLVTCTLLARYLPLLAVARRCSCSYPQGSVACEY